MSRIFYSDETLSQNLSPGQRLSDKIADFGGSWMFIITFMTFILFWLLTNVYVLTMKPFESISIYTLKPYPVMYSGIAGPNNNDESEQA